MGSCVGAPKKGAEVQNETVATTTSQSTNEPQTKEAATPAKTTGDYKGEIKLLLLGAGESGKSTIWKQMKFIHLEGFSDKDLDDLFKPAAFENVVQLLLGLLQVSADTSGSDVSNENMEIAQLLQKQDINNIHYTDWEGKREPLLELWKDPSIQNARGSVTQLPLVLQDSAKYWFKHIERVLDPGYKPTVKDIIKTRNQTTGIMEIVFEIDGYKFKLTDVGGQRSERKKWISCFQNLTAILFVVALSEYDQTLNEDTSTNRMAESLKLFKGVVGNDALHHVAMILFLNKEDLFSQKIQKSDLKKFFPEYNGPSGDKDAAFEFIKNQFVSLNTNPSRKIFTQTTIATDRDNIRQAMDTVKNIVIDYTVSNTKPL